MQGKTFFDSNVVIYAYYNKEERKQQISRQLMAESNAVISTQVLQEISNSLKRKFKMEYSAIKALLTECIKNCREVHINTRQTIFKACDIAERYQFSFYDSLIISAALESGCKVLYSEDLQHRQAIENTLTIINPYV